MQFCLKCDNVQRVCACVFVCLTSRKLPVLTREFLYHSKRKATRVISATAELLVYCRKMAECSAERRRDVTRHIS